ncbi:MAG: Stp1/IreP family PP2C-type Ser/Thr phosphatase, partial [Ruminococcaceae bacterium]|nr:Stp1/IreP family PP2C-type Ser/Thr phosphatase [Oscillospiraceae bacterium]
MTFRLPADNYERNCCEIGGDDVRMGKITDRGRVRKNNEDSFFTYRNENLIGGMVADGMGGHSSGEIASRMTTMIVKDHIISKFNPDMAYAEVGEMIRRAFIDSNAEVYEYAKHHPESQGMGTTASMAFIYKGKLISIHVGDSRVYLIEGEKIRQITTDHSLLQELLSRGKISKDDAENYPNKNIITRAIGAEPAIKVDVIIEDYNGGTVCVCSDGLTNMVSDEQIKNIINENEDLQKGVEKLVELANKKG